MTRGWFTSAALLRGLRGEMALERVDVPQIVSRKGVTDEQMASVHEAGRPGTFG